MDKKQTEAIPTRREVEAKLAKVGDYVKMDYLANCLKMNLDFDTRKYVLTTLSKIYESRSMFSEAAKLMRWSADINTTYDGKINDFMSSVELYIKAGAFDESDVSFNKALVLANQNQKNEVKNKRKLMYAAQAKEYIRKDRRKHAMETYEKLLTLDLGPNEKRDVQNVLLGLYEKLGKVRDFYTMKKSGETPATARIERQERQAKQAQERKDKQIKNKFMPDNVDNLIGNDIEMF